MVYINNDAGTRFSDMGIYIKPAHPQKHEWELSTILVLTQPAQNISGSVSFFAHNDIGVPISDLIFFVGWQDGYSCVIPDYKGRSTFNMDREYNPDLGSGPYWGGFLEDGIAPMVCGFGIPKGYACDIKFVYARIWKDKLNDCI